MRQSLIEKLKENSWIEVREDWEYRKGDWVLLRDTGSCWMVGTRLNPRVFDVLEPNEYAIAWTFNLIEHLCKMEDEKVELQKKLEDSKLL